MSMARTFTSMVSRVDVRCCEGAVDGVHFVLLVTTASVLGALGVPSTIVKALPDIVIVELLNVIVVVV